MNKVRRYIDTPELMNWYVNIYKVDRAYGGPEEGGWYYDVGELVETKCFCSAEPSNKGGMTHTNAVVINSIDIINYLLLNILFLIVDIYLQHLVF